MLFTTKFLSNIFTENNGQSHPVIGIKNVVTDTRKDLQDCLFIPLKGENFDAHNFLESAIEKGAAAALWEKNKPLPATVKEGFPLFFVDDTLSALHVLAKQYLKEISPVVVGVTGSNGKTTTKDLIGTVASSVYNTHRTDGNYNNHIGLPLTILSMPADTEVLVLEMGMSKAGEIEKLSQLAEPAISVITNIGESHIEHFGSREGIAKAKTEILAGMQRNGVLVFDGDEPLLKACKKRENSISCGFSGENMVVINEVTMHKNSTTFTVNGEPGYKLGMLGKHNAKNASFAISVARQLKIPEEKIKRALENVQLTGMRFEMLEGKNGSTIINDAYNASPTSMKASIEVLKEMSQYKNKVLVLGDIYELGENAKELHKAVAEVITSDIDALFTIGNHANEITEKVVALNQDTKASHIESFPKLTEQLCPYLQPETVILLKASRGMKLERILTDLQ